MELSKLNKNRSVAHIKKSLWVKDIDFRIKNRKWLKYSTNIARRILAVLGENGNTTTQVELARKIGVSAQYINKVLKGNENLTLSTIAKISDVIGVELISFPQYKNSIPRLPIQYFIPQNCNYITLIETNTTFIKMVDNNVENYHIAKALSITFSVEPSIQNLHLDDTSAFYWNNNIKKLESTLINN